MKKSLNARVIDLEKQIKYLEKLCIDIMRILDSRSLSNDDMKKLIKRKN